MTLVNFPKCSGLYILTEVVGNLSNNLGFGSGVFHFLVGNYISLLIVRFKMKVRMLVQVALNFSHLKPKVSAVQ